ncbi:MAG: hypothetical protein U5L00_05270 [Desulfovermiculus sp.]|nr:hypothetical protein [Desulfovermiculus sp.]
MHRGSPLRKINVLVTRDHDEDIDLNGRRIHIISAWRFLLGLPDE